MKGNQPIYNNVEDIVDLKEMEPVFLDVDDGIDVIKSSKFASLDIDPEDFTQEHFIDAEQKGAIVTDVIEKFFEASEYNLARFNRDYQLGFSEVPDSDKFDELRLRNIDDELKEREE